MSSATEPLVHNSAKRHFNYLTGDTDLAARQEKSSALSTIRQNWKFLCGLTIVLGIICIASVGYLRATGSSSPSVSLFEAEEWTEIDHVDAHARFQRGIWEESETCADDTPFTMKILPVLQNMDKLHDMLLEVSDPKSSKYGEYYDLDFINNFFGASSETLDAIYEWLDSYGLDTDTIKAANSKYGGDMIEFETTCGLASTMLNAEYVVWKHVASGDETIGVRDDYFVPLSISKHIDLIGPTVRFPARYAKKERIKLAGTYYIGKKVHVDNIKKYMQHIEPELRQHLRESKDTRNRKMAKHQKNFLKKDS